MLKQGSFVIPKVIASDSAESCSNDETKNHNSELLKTNLSLLETQPPLEQESTKPYQHRQDLPLAKIVSKTITKVRLPETTAYVDRKEQNQLETIESDVDANYKNTKVL